jgi:hypothetical protein
LDFDINSTSDDIKNSMKLLGVAEQTKFLSTTMVKLSIIWTLRGADFRLRAASSSSRPAPRQS